MAEPSAPRRRSRRWLLILLVCVAVFVAAAATHLLLDRFIALYPFGSNGEESGLAENEHLILVRLDSLLSEISINGSVAFSNKRDLNFGSSGFIDEILVSEGEIVSEGQPLARLDPESVANLRSAVAEAQIEYEEAQDKLDEARQPVLQTAEAETALAEAALELHNAQQSLDDLLTAKPEDIASAEAALADASLEVQTAQEALDDLRAPKPEDVADAEADIAQARVTLQDAEHALGSEYSNSAADLEIAERELSVAMQLLEYSGDNAKLTEARKTFEQEREGYSNVIYKWTGVSATDEDLAMTPSDLFAALEFVPELVFERDYPLFSGGRIADNPDTRWNELKIFAWRALYPGFRQIEIQCEHITLLPEVTTSDTTNTNAELCIQRDMDNAFEALRTARDALNSAEAEFDENIASLKERLAQAQKAQVEAQDKLNRLQGGSIDNLLLQKRFNKARADLEAAEKSLRELTDPPNPMEWESKRKSVALAQAKRDSADEALDTLINPDPQEVAAKRRQLALAQAKIQDAERTLQRLNDRRELQITLQEGAVASAQAKVEGATRRYEDSTLKAPWDGYVASIPVEAGKEIEPFELILTIVNSSIVQIEGRVDEIDILSLHRDAVASVTMDALPEQTLEGTVKSISSTGTNENGIVTFDVKIEVNLPDDITLQEGLSAIAKVATEEKRGLIIPVQAVRYRPEGSYVRMMSEEGRIIEQPVTLGDSDGFLTIVEEGLEEGDEIAMRVLDDSPFDFDDFGPPPPDEQSAEASYEAE